MKKYAFFDFAYTIASSYFSSNFSEAYTKSIKLDMRDKIFEENNRLKAGLNEGNISYNEVVNQMNATFADILKGESVDEISEFAKKLFADVKIFNYVVPILKYLEENGFEIYIITADFGFNIQGILDTLPQGFNVFSSSMEVSEGKFTGKIEELLNSTKKSDIVDKVVGKGGEVFAIAFGDSQGDMPMLNKSDLGFFINEDEEEYKKNVSSEHIILINEPDSIDSVSLIIKKIESLMME